MCIKTGARRRWLVYPQIKLYVNNYDLKYDLNKKGEVCEPWKIWFRGILGFHKIETISCMYMSATTV